MIARSLRAGHSFTTAIQLVGQEVASPAGDLFKLAYDQQQLGLRLADALAELNGRIDSLDLRFFTTVVAINTEIGGNLSEVLDKLALTIRERLRIRRQVRVFTAQGRMSGYVLGALPVVSFLIISFVYPDYERALFREPTGIYIVVFAAVLQLFGLMVIRRIIRIQI
nr:type II secretion system F family protein [Geomonas sp. Red32]